MTGLQISYLVVLGLCVAGSSFFSGAETALVRIPRERAHQLEGSHRGRMLADLVGDPDRMLSTLLVANNIVNILATAIATTLFIDLAGSDWGPWLATLAVTAVILVLGEITPKTLASRYPERFSLVVAPTVWRLSRLLGPVPHFFQGITRLLFRALRLPSDTEPRFVTEEDIRAMAVLGEKEGEIETAEREIIHAVFELADRPVRDVMTPRVDVVSLSHPVTAAEVRRIVTLTGHSRFPVIAGDIDSIVGVLYVKDLLGRPGDPDPVAIQRSLRQPVYVPESKPILELLQEMKAGRRGFAVVVDEHGGVAGIITVKDLISQLTGDLHDEYDRRSPAVVEVGPGKWVADGRVGIEEVEELVKVELPAGEYSTVGGLFLGLAGRIPEAGDSVTVDGIRLTVLEMERNRIDRLQVERISDQPAG